MPSLVKKEMRGFDRLLNDSPDIEIFQPQLNPTGDDAGNLQQIVNQMHELMHLPADDSSCLPLQGTCLLLEPQDLHGIDDRRQRIAELMGEHRQKFVLA